MAKRTGVLLINLGTPDSTGYWPMRRYLKEFLSDKRVIEASGPVWWAVLNGIILTKRPRKSGRAYDKIWNQELNESPLRTFTRSQTEKTAARFADQPDLVFDWAMRYGNPSISEGISHLLELGCQRILLFPLYPQYSSATTATAMDKVFDSLMELRFQPEIRQVPPYFENGDYINAIADSIKEHRSQLAWEPDVILASFHGLPVDFIAKGDPYQFQCEQSAGLLGEALGLDENKLLLTYQSRPGRAVWTGPDTEETLARLAAEGVRNVMVVTPGFISDCVETLEEIAIRAAGVFRQNGGENFTHVPCLNDSDGSVNLLTRLIKSELSGWNN